MREEPLPAPSIGRAPAASGRWGCVGGFRRAVNSRQRSRKRRVSSPEPLARPRSLRRRRASAAAPDRDADARQGPDSRRAVPADEVEHRKAFMVGDYRLAVDEAGACR
jgi:hypothetical protein